MANFLPLSNNNGQIEKAAGACWRMGLVQY